MAIFVISLLGFILRILFLNQHNLWFDEAFTYHISRLPIKDLIIATAYDNNPPLYYLLIHYILYLGNSEIVLRFTSVIIGTLTTPLVFLLGKKVYSQKAGLASSLLYSLSPLSVYHSTEVRMYGLAAFLITVCLLIIFTLKKNSTWQSHILLVFFLTLSFYTNLYALLLLIPAIVYKNSRLDGITALVLFIPWLTTFTLDQKSSCGVCTNSFLALPATLASPAVSGLGEVSIRSYTQLPLIIFFIFSTTSILLAIIFLRGLLSFDKVSVSYILILGILIITGLIKPVFSARAASVFLPLFFLTIGKAVYFFKKPHMVLFGICVLLVAVDLIQMQDHFFKGDSLKKSGEIISKNNNPVFHTSLATYYSLRFYAPSNQHFLITDNPLSKNTVSLIGGEKTPIQSINSYFYMVDTEKWTDKKEIEKITDSIKNKNSLINETNLGTITIKQYK